MRFAIGTRIRKQNSINVIFITSIAMGEGFYCVIREGGYIVGAHVVAIIIE
ncbi:hypothetical protein [Candidatus Enterovibrio altilux]|uniref:hypothetical protein n=1 Tax=Candidatus Enterovibrio altilux TaxID=1927128 RepID=UPI001681BE94|nr:hypothetical protein [Candidatus Enterovibrio luxaltus]